MNNSSASYQKGEGGGGGGGVRGNFFQRLWEITIPSPDSGGGGVLCTMNNQSDSRREDNEGRGKFFIDRNRVFIHWRSQDFSTEGPKRGSEATERGEGV